MNTQNTSHLATPRRLFSLASVVLGIVLADHRAMSESLIIPSGFADKEGSQVLGTVSNNPHRIQSLYLGSEFPQEPIEIIGMRHRPKSGTPTQSPTYRDLQVRLTTTKDAALARDFVVNLDRGLEPPIFVINGTVETHTVRPVPDQSPRAFDYEFLWEETPFRFDPADGTNLLVDFNAPYGSSVPHRTDAIDTGQSPGQPRMVLSSPANFFHDYDSRFHVTEFIYRLVETTALPGDYNHDGSVDAADYVVWRHSVGQTGAGLAADGNGDSLVNQADHDLWRSHFGQTVPGDAGDSASASRVPEPTGLALASLLAAILLAAASHRKFPTACRANDRFHDPKTRGDNSL